MASNRTGRIVRLPGPVLAVRPVMADVLRRDRSPVMAADVLPGRRRAKARAGVLQDHRRAKVRADVLQGHLRGKAPAVALRGNQAAVALRGSQAAVGALRDHHPVMAAEVTAVAATAAVDKAATAVATNSSRAVSRNLSPASSKSAPLRRQQHAGDDRNVTGFASLASEPPALKNHLPDRAPASTAA
jgi:hypothetical protein